MNNLRNKIYYKRNRKELCKIALLILIIMIYVCLLIKLSDMPLNKNLTCVPVYFISFVYYKNKDKEVRNMLKNNVFCSQHSQKCIKNYHRCLVFHFVFLLLFTTTSLSLKTVDFVYLGGLMYLIIMGCALMNYNFIIIFKEQGYSSGEYYIKYEEITDIISEKEIPTRDGILFFCKIVQNKKVLGYDKFLYDDYIYARKMMKKMVSE